MKNTLFLILFVFCIVSCKQEEITPNENADLEIQTVIDQESPYSISEDAVKERVLKFMETIKGEESSNTKSLSVDNTSISLTTKKVKDVMLKSSSLKSTGIRIP